MGQGKREGKKTKLPYPDEEGMGRQAREAVERALKR